jgi:uncharacterized protein YabN with tetrapyrrole methylase and pyrophosphatase domain
VGQLTQESIAWIREAEALLYVVGDPVAEAVMTRLNPDAAQSMAGHYKEGHDRLTTYLAMVDQILECVRSGKRTVVALYGHPGVFAFPSHESIRRARAEGYPAQMLPGVSAEDCLFADLGVDPAVGGCQSYEATDFLLNARVIDTSAQLILWQIGTLGDWTYKSRMYDLRAFPLMVQRLCELYPPTHTSIVYEAAIFPGVAAGITQVPIGALSPAHVSAATTLYVPPARPAVPDPRMSAWFQAMQQAGG